MKGKNRIIVGMLVVMGFGSCAQRAAKSRAVEQPVETRAGSANTATISGRVTDAGNSEPLAGVSISKEKNSDPYAITSPDGEYSIEVAIGDTLYFSYIGYRYQIHKVNGKSLYVQLREFTNSNMDATLIEEEKDNYDKLKPMLVMYGAPRRDFEPVLKIRKGKALADPAETETAPAGTENTAE